MSEANHSVTYATACSDLLELEERGYLDRHTSGRAFVFTSSPDLRERLRSLQAEI